MKDSDFLKNYKRLLVEQGEIRKTLSKVTKQIKSLNKELLNGLVYK